MRSLTTPVGSDWRHHGTHQGGFTWDSACSYRQFVTVGSPNKIDLDVQLAKELNVIGLMNIQFVVVGTGYDPQVYILEANPCSDCAFVSKATGVPLAKLASHYGGRNFGVAGIHPGTHTCPYCRQGSRPAVS